MSDLDEGFSDDPYTFVNVYQCQGCLLYMLYPSFPHPCSHADRSDACFDDFYTLFELIEDLADNHTNQNLIICVMPVN